MTDKNCENCAFTEDFARKNPSTGKVITINGCINPAGRFYGQVSTKETTCGCWRKRK